MTGHPARDPLPDALRALAMVSVLTVNAAGYLVAPWGPALGTAQEGGAAVLQWLMAALLQGKGYPSLAFVFGMGLWLAMRGRGRHEALVRGLARQRRLRLLGVVHGVFIYFGDILTLYGLVGGGVLRSGRVPWRVLRQHLRRAVGWALVAVLAPLPLVALLGWQTPAVDAADPTLAQATGWLDFWSLNAQAYAATLLLSLVLAWPVIRLCMLCGLAAARLRLLTHPRWRPGLRRWTVRLAPPLLALNLLTAWFAVADRSAPGGWPLVETLGSLAGLLLAPVLLMALALGARGGRAAWCGWIAPLGRRTLTLYVGHGLLCVALFSGVGLGLRPGLPAMAAGSLGLWVLALLAARASGRKRWPLEVWLAAR